MPDPQLTFNREELTLTIANLGGGLPLGRLGELRLLDQAQIQLPPSWSKFKTGVAMQVVEAQWRLNAEFLLTQTLEAGVSFTRADGVGSSLKVEHDLTYHLLTRPTVKVDLFMKVKLDGRYSGGAYDGSGQIGLGIKARF